MVENQRAGSLCIVLALRSKVPAVEQVPQREAVQEMKVEVRPEVKKFV